MMLHYDYAKISNLEILKLLQLCEEYRDVWHAAYFYHLTEHQQSLQMYHSISMIAPNSL